MVRRKKKAVHEREIEGRSILKTMLVPSGIAGIVELINCTWKLNWIRTNKGGGTKISWAQGRKVPKYGPGTNPSQSYLYFHSEYLLLNIFTPSHKSKM